MASQGFSVISWAAMPPLPEQLQCCLKLLIVLSLSIWLLVAFQVMVADRLWTVWRWTAQLRSLSFISFQLLSNTYIHCATAVWGWDYWKLLLLGCLCMRLLEITGVYWRLLFLRPNYQAPNQPWVGMGVLQEIQPSCGCASVHTYLPYCSICNYSYSPRRCMP